MNVLKILLILFFLITVGMIPAVAQKNKSYAAVEMEISDESGNAIPFAIVSSAKKRNIYTTGENGRITLQLPPDDMLKVSAKGYVTEIVSVDNAGKIMLRKELDFNGESDVLYTLFGKTTERRTVGAWSKVDGKDLESNPTMFFLNSLGGRLNGLFTMDNTLVPGFTNANTWFRSQQGNLLIMVDGVERSLDYIEPETVESVELLKDASLKSLYGGIDISGILMIRTRRGKAFENSARVNVQTGVQQPSRLPEYLDAYDYATMYNAAAVANGMDPVFHDIEKYRTGEDPILYPNVDYYDMFLNRQMPITRANMQYSGGNEKTKFFTHVGYQTNGGLEKYTQYPNRDRVYTIRGNVDNTILNFITFSAGFNAALQNKSWPNLSTQNFFNMLSDTRPNEFPIFIPGENIGQPDKEYVLGGTSINRNNPYGALMNGGYAEREYSYLQSDFTLNIDLDKWVKGLSVRPMFTFDMYNYFTSTQGATYVVWEPRATGNPESPVSYSSWGQETRATSMSRSGATTNRNYAFNVVATYNRAFGKHDINSLLVYFQQRKEYNSLSQDLKRQNLGGLVNYMYDNRYTAEVSLNRVGVGSFAPSKRFGVFPTFGAGWIMNEEPFMREIPWLDYLKLRASYGILGSTSYTSEGLFSAYLYRDVWEPGGSYGGVSGFNNIAREIQTGNPNVGFQKTYELNAGIDFLLFRSLRASVGYFTKTLDGVLSSLSDITPGVSGKNAVLMMQNYKRYKSAGWEAEAMYERRIGDFQFSLGANLCYGTSKILIEAEPDYPEELKGLRKIRKVGDVLGQRYAGVFADAADISNSPKQGFGLVNVGDLKYADTNKDGRVDNGDREVIANTTPSMQYGITFRIEYKGINLDVLGYGLGGFDRILDNKYYQIYGMRKYSNVLIDGLPNGNPHPVLSPQYRNNNFITSDYWVVDGSYFKLRNVELGYTLPYMLTEKINIGKVKVFVRGANLFTISKIKDLDPENLEAGVGNFPLGKTITGGVSVAF
ncbi:SusC/RagA family TonB-linked outer membrane protein [uncultured Proteiniphilum sp.]|uniref:SusC/RagA family TonB-linked outer membrane protein n=1 Tax=uncultured Proteiniphilum sp. TaxID=497637 RepID=UPI0026249788|nr:SusC/RagA family TonB-linked outer membrane protein [uncultured Proteiniphilum sp.]